MANDTEPRSGAAYERYCALTDLPMTVLAVAWLPLIVVPLIVNLHGAADAAVSLSDYVLWAVFAVDYGIRLWLAPARWHFIVHHKLDLVTVVLPALRPLRVLRILRLARSGALAWDVLARGKALLTHRGLHYVLLTATLIVFASAALEVPFESHSAGGGAIHDYGQALWWAVVTATTVGYGDRVPQSPAGQGVATILMLLGIGLVGVLTATIASFFVAEEGADMRAEVGALREQLTRVESLLARLVAADEGSPDTPAGLVAGEEADVISPAT